MIFEYKKPAFSINAGFFHFHSINNILNIIMIDLIDNKISSYFIKLKNLNESKRHKKAKFVGQNTYE